VPYLHLLGLKEPASNLAPEGTTVGYRRYRARRSIYAACAGVAAAGTLWAGANVYQMIVVHGDTQDAVRQTAQLQQRYQEITRQFPAAPASAENLKRTVEIAQRLRDSGRTPEKMMALVSRSLEESPTIMIREFGWKYGTSEIPVERVGAGPAAAPEPLPVAALPGSPAAPVLFRRQSALIEGEIRPFRGDYRSAIETINAFATRLGKDQTVAEVRVVKLPLNVNPALSLAGNTLDNPDQSAIADFKVLLVLKPNT
jgi:hypothetical protein